MVVPHETEKHHTILNIGLKRKPLSTHSQNSNFPLLFTIPSLCGGLSLQKLETSPNEPLCYTKMTRNFHPNSQFSEECFSYAGNVLTFSKYSLGAYGLTGGNSTPKLYLNSHVDNKRSFYQ